MTAMMRSVALSLSKAATDVQAPKNQLGLNEVQAKPAETLEPEIRVACRYILVGVT